MKDWLVGAAFCVFLGSSMVSEARDCKLEVNYGFAAQNSETVDVRAGKTKTHVRSHVRRVKNIGQNNAEIYVQGGFGAEPAWHRINKNESYVGFVDLKKAKCLRSSDGPRNPVEQLAGRARSEANMLHDSTQAVAKSLEQHVGKALGVVKDLAQDWYDDVSSDQWWSVGRAVLCDSYLGNQDNQRILNLQQLQFKGARGNQNKFDNLVVSNEFNVVNNYLLMQASNKTYYHQLKHGFDAEKRIWNKANTEREFRCAAQELYRYWGFEDVWFANGLLGGNAVIGIDADKVVIAVRGTQNPGEFTQLANFDDNQAGIFNAQELVDESAKGAMDVLLNMSHFKVPAMPLGFTGPDDAGGEVHGGYAMAAMELHGLIDLMNSVEAISDRPIFVTGHSLGGATATLLAKRMQQQGYEVRAAYIYAPPKVGDSRFANALRNDLNLFVTWNYRDPVPTFLNSELFKLGGFSVTGIDKFRFTWEGAQRFIFFDQAHNANIYEPDGQNHKAIYLDLREKQGAPYPEVLLRNGPMSEEWFFHNGNFYTAFTYNAVVEAGINPVANSAIHPEFIKESMCLFWSDSFKKHKYDWNAWYERFTKDKQGYPMQHCMW